MSSNYFEIVQAQFLEGCHPTAIGDVNRSNICIWADRVFLIGCFSVILFVSSVDTWFACANPNILIDEKNPLCKLLLDMAPGSRACFIAGKTVGTLLVLSTLYCLLCSNYQYARHVIAAVTLFQLGLLIYLYLSDPLLDDWINFFALFDKEEPSILKAMLYETMRD